VDRTTRQVVLGKKCGYRKLLQISVDSRVIDSATVEVVIVAGIQYINHQVTNPTSGDMRQNTTTNTMEIYNGSSWTPIAPGWEKKDFLFPWEKKESLADSVAHAADTVAMYIEEDHADNITIQDAYAAWCEATERFRVVLTMAEK